MVHSAPKALPVRFALVGVGRWGANYLDVFADFPGAELVALCDPDPVALSRGVKRKPVNSAVASLSGLRRADVDAVIIATPTDSHVRLASEAFEMGFHVLVEKPLAMTAVEALAVINAAERAERLLSVGYQMLHHPGHVALVREVAKLGPLRHIRTIRSSVRRERQDPVLLALGPHDLATLTVLSGRSDYVCDSTEGDGISTLTARLRSIGTGLTAELRFGRGTPLRLTEVVGRDGTASLDESSGIVTVNGAEVFAGCVSRPLDLQCADFVAKIASGAHRVADHLAGISRLIELVQAEVSRPVHDAARPLQLSP